MQHERDPLGGGQCLEYHEQGETDRVGQQGLLLGVDGGRVTDRTSGAIHHQLGCTVS